MSLASQFLATLNAIGNDIKSLVSQTTKANKTEAEGLTDNTKLMTPLRVKEAVDAIIRTGKIVHTGNTPPVDPIDNMLWYDTDEDYLAIFLNNGTTSQWVTILGGAGSSTTAWADITDKPTSFPPDIHQHDWSSIQNKPSGYVPISHSHSISEVDGLLAAFNNKISSTEKGEASGVAPLDESSKIPAIYLPASDVANNDLLLHGPIIVIQNVQPSVIASNASGIPLIKIQIIFSKKDTLPPPYSISLPNGNITNAANLKHCTPIGIPTMVMHQKIPINAQLIARINPPKINQSIFPKHDINNPPIFYLI